ncbi:MAG: prolipoprotein diacylglyceryl transferase [Candidatus Omnitrophica bacterium]|nr:prolipoprotein diacylglyceryl transferase [Candidatus Omnitrophota bacterium]
MWPILFKIGPYSVSTYYVMYAIAFFSALSVAIILGKKRSFRPKVFVDASFFTLFFAIVGSRLFYVIFNYSSSSNTDLNYMITLFLHGGNVSFGAILGGAIALFIFLYLNRFTRPRFWEALDVFSPPTALGIFFGRLGCFFAGCCHGKPAFGLPWAVVYNNPLSACVYKGIPIHPTQLYEAFGALLLFFFLLFLFKKELFKGQLCWIFFLFYGVLRFGVEFFRGDPRPMVTPYLSLGQVICIGFILFSISALLWRNRTVFKRRKVVNDL